MLLRHFQIPCFGLKYLSGSWGKQFKPKSQGVPLPGHFLSTFRGIPRCSHASQKVWALKYVLGLSLGILLAGHAINPSPARNPGGI